MLATQPTPARVLLARIYWIMFGPLFLFMLAYQMATRNDGWTAGSDILYLVFLAGLMIARWLEYRVGSPDSTTGQVLSRTSLVHYCVLAVSLGMIVWIVANIVGNRPSG